MTLFPHWYCTFLFTTFVRERREHRVFTALLNAVPGLEDRLMTGTEEDIHFIATLVSKMTEYCLHSLSLRNDFFQLQKGASSARSDDTKSLKSAIVDWLSPPNEPLIPPIARNVKIDRGFNHHATGALLCPAGVDWSDNVYVIYFDYLLPIMRYFVRIQEKLRTGELSVSGDQWPIFLYSGYKFIEDDPWKGLLRSAILVKVNHVRLVLPFHSQHRSFGCQAFKHIFTSPSSVEREAKATRSGNARIHGMTRVTPASIAYAATQVSYKVLQSLAYMIVSSLG